MRITRPPISFEDERGTITDILQDVAINSVTYIVSKKGSRRGDHYHKETTQWMYILTGSLGLSVNSGSSGCGVDICPGDLVCISPGEWHTIIANVDSTFIVFTSGPRAGTEYESDTVHISEVWREYIESILVKEEEYAVAPC